jgi:hypothetical protein
VRGRIDGPLLTSLLSRDEIKTLHEWLDDPERTIGELGGKAWTAFLAQCHNTFKIDPAGEGELRVAEQLGGRQGNWEQAWQRFREAPRSYPRIPELLRRARPGQLFVDHPDSWPQDNDEAEQALATALAGLSGAAAAEAGAVLAKLEVEHALRRGWVWAQLGQAQLAFALAHLTRLSELTALAPPPGPVAELVAWYAGQGWRVDESVMGALAAVTDPGHRDAVSIAITALYLPWFDEIAWRFQDAAVNDYAGNTGLEVRAGDCVVFVDGLRYDIGEALRAVLAKSGCEAAIVPRLAPFPTVTGTGKPGVAPIGGVITGGQEMNAADAEGRALIGDTLRTYLRKAGVQPLGSTDTGDPSGKGWTEAADIDTTGHNLGLKLADRARREVDDIAARVQELLSAGWNRVFVVTDHGWILMPGKLPKTELPEHLTVVRKARCARLTTTAQSVNHPTIPWTWDESVRMVSPRGAASFEAGRVYEHGGLSGPSRKSVGG